MKRAVLVGFLIAAVFALACDDELAPPTTGSIALNIVFEPADAPLVQRVSPDSIAAEHADGARSETLVPQFGAAGFTAVRARTQDGPTEKTVNLTLGADGFWDGEMPALLPGTYTVLVEGLVDGELDARGVSSSVTVVAGATGTATVSMAQGSFKPSLNPIASPGNRLSFPVSWSAVTGATGYRVEWSKPGAGGGSRNLDSTNIVVAVSDTGTWSVQVRGTITGAAGATGAASTPQSVTVQGDPPGSTGDDPATAPPLPFGFIDTTITQLNIAPSSDQDWFAIDACLADTVVAATRAAVLAPPSSLNTRLRLTNSDGTVLIAENDDDGVTTDSRIRVDGLPVDGRYNVQVSSAGGTGHYEVDIRVLPGLNNTGTQCLQITSVSVTPDTVSLDALGATQQLTAVALDALNDTVPGVVFNWQSSDLAVATVDANGLVTSVGNGTATISATSPAPPPPAGARATRAGPASGDAGAAATVTAAQPVTGTASVTVVQVPAAVVVTPPTATLTAVGETLQLGHDVQDRLGASIAGASVTWGTSSGTVAMVSATGLVTANASGAATITATSGTASGGAAVTVNATFTGIVTVGGTGTFADLVTVNPGSIAWDGDEIVTVSGEQPWIESQSTSAIALRIPNLPVGTQRLEIANQGPNQLTQFFDISVTGGFARNVSPVGAPNIAGGAFPLIFFISLEDDLTNPGNDDHYLAVNPAGANLGLSVVLEWQGPAVDLDVTWENATGTVLTGNIEGASLSNPERTGEIIPPLADWRLHFNKFDTGTPRTMARVTIEQTSVGTSITAGRFHTCAVHVDGRAQCWGYNEFGQLGNGTTTFSATPVDAAGGHRFTAISAGRDHTCAVDDVGAAWCWGRNTWGQLGNGSFTESDVPVAVSGGLTFRAVAGGGRTSCGITAAGDAYCWGRGAQGERGDGTFTSLLNTPQLVSGGRTYQSLGVGQSHGCAVTTAGAAYCWGENSTGMLGDGTTTRSNVPVAVVGVGGGPALTLSTVTAGDFHSCAVAPGGIAYCWGFGGQGQRGDGTFSPSSTPTQVATGLWSIVDAGSRHTCGVSTAGTAQCWGRSVFGERGDGTTADVNTPTTVLTLGTSAGISAGGGHSCAIDDLGEAWCWGRSGSGQLGDAVTPAIVPTLGPGFATIALAAGQNHGCAVDATNQAWCWGVGSSGQLGDGLFTSSPSAVQVSGVLSFRDVDAGGVHTCAVRTAPVNAAYCWGFGGSGQLGNGSAASQGSPVLVSGGHAWSMVRTGSAHSCGITTAGQAYCWGFNVDGQLGDGSNIGRNMPVLVAGGRLWDDISAGVFHTCGIERVTGDAYCWGFGGVGELGNGATNNSNVPVLVSGGLSFQFISAGRQVSCGATAGAAAYCWGSNGFGQLGTGTQSSASAPALVSGGLAIRQVFTSMGAIVGSSRPVHTCGVTTTNAVHCWGDNTFGALGDGTLEGALSPVAVSGPALGLVIPGGGFTCGVTGFNGTIYCWGNNSDGQIGNGTRAIRTTPVAVAGGGVFREPPPASNLMGPTVVRSKAKR